MKRIHPVILLLLMMPGPVTALETANSKNSQMITGADLFRATRNAPWKQNSQSEKKNSTDQVSKGMVLPVDRESFLRRLSYFGEESRSK